MNYIFSYLTDGTLEQEISCPPHDTHLYLSLHCHLLLFGMKHTPEGLHSGLIGHVLHSSAPRKYLNCKYKFCNQGLCLGIIHQCCKNYFWWLLSF